ncbi:MAG: nuclease [Micrococcales bacterium]|nr:MAG: nuclease [Micrococcales bacterium]
MAAAAAEQAEATAAAAGDRAALDALVDASQTLQDQGYSVVLATRWPGTRNTLVEMLLAGPGGVFLVSSVPWTPIKIRDGQVEGPPDLLTRAVRTTANTMGRLEDVLGGIGLAPGEIHAIGALAPHRDADPLELRVRHEQVTVMPANAIVAHVEQLGSRLSPQLVVDVVNALAELFPDQLDQIGLDPEQHDSTPTDLLPWMTRLTPEQSLLVRRDWSGPARLRGAAGTGKTVVGLHRAAYVARHNPGRVLVVSLVRTLPKVLERRFRTLSPDTADKVDFTSVHRLALDVLNRRRVRSSVDLGAAALAFRRAWDNVGSRSPLAQVPVPATYWQEEIDHVIKGRGISSLEEYLALERVGRVYPLQAQMRRQMWTLLNAYQAELSTRGVHDLADILSSADAELAREPWDVDYSAVIVDEAQDLSPVALRLLHRLVGDKPNGLLLIADGQQGVTPGGFHVGEAGVSVTGRDAVLRTNMRSERLIGARAHEVIAGDVFDDLDGFAWHPDRELAWALEGGQEPVRVLAKTQEEHDDALLRWLQLVAGGNNNGSCDVAVLAARHGMISHYRQLLVGRGFEVVDLDGYDGSPTDAVKIGTMRRAKGLQFSHVAIPQLRLGPSGTCLTVDDTGQEDANIGYERSTRERREIFSAMSRAITSLWVGYLN